MRDTQARWIKLLPVKYKKLQDKIMHKTNLIYSLKGCYDFIEFFQNIKFGFIKKRNLLKHSAIIVIFFISLISLTSCFSPPSFKLIQIKEINCQLTDSEIFEINKIGEHQMEFYQQVFNYPRNFSFKIEVFGDSTQYREYQHKISKNARSRNGFYSSTYKKAIISKNKRFLKTISHEMNHFILRAKINNVPKWINEGLSEYYEMAHLANGFIKIKPQMKKVERLKKIIQRPQKLELTDFLTWENKKWSSVNKAGEYYSSTLSWGIIYYLKSRLDGDEILTKMLLDLKKGNDSILTIERNYAGGITRLEHDMINYFTLEFAE